MSTADEDFAWHMSFSDQNMESQDYPDEYDDDWDDDEYDEWDDDEDDEEDDD